MKTLMIPIQSWRDVRELCAGRADYKFDAETLEKELEAVTSRNAAVGLISSLSAIGLLDDNGQLTELGLKWSNDATYPEACREIIKKYFPEETCDAIDAEVLSNAEVINRYAELTEMNQAGAKKNIRVLRMLMEDSSQTRPASAPEQGGDGEVDAGSDTSEQKTPKRKARSKKPKKSAILEGAEIASVNAKAHIEMTIPIEKLSEVMVAVFAKISPDEALFDIKIV